MSPKANQVLEQALLLAEGDRAAVAGALIASLEGPSEPGADEAWNEVIRQRTAQLDAGAVDTLPWSDVRAQLFRGFE